jgi:S-adenosylmethionine hydrolase
MPRPFISLLTDFGLRDPSAAIMRGVVHGIAPDARVLDISHEVRKYRIRDGALLLWCALPYLPVGAHVAVVDPGVGTERRPVAVQVNRGDILIGPDNGVLMMAADKLSGVAAAVELTKPAFRLPVVSTSFHGRDIFAPAAAHLANGVRLDDLGPPVDPATLVRHEIPDAVATDGRLETHVLYVDTFGNVKLTALAENFRAALGQPPPGTRLRVAVGAEGRLEQLSWRTTFGDAAPREPLLYEDSYGRLCLAVNQGDAATQLGLEEDQRVVIERA